MANRTLTADIIAKEAVMILDNELIMAKKVFRGYEEDYTKKINGYEVGDTISIRRPADFQVRDGKTADAQDAQEGKTTIVIDKFKGVDFKFTSQDLTLSINNVSERIIKPAMVQLANQIDVDLHGLYKDVPNWVGTPGNYAKNIAKRAQRLDENAAPKGDRCAILSPADHWGLLGSQTSLFSDTIVNPAYRTGQTGRIAGVDLYASQNVARHTTGTRASTDLVDQTLIATTATWAATRDTNTYTLHIDGTGGATDTVAQGDCFTIANCFDVNPVTKARLSHLKMFTVTALATMSSNEGDIIISPPPIGAGAHQNVDFAVTDLDDDVVTWVPSTASTAYNQNMVFHKNAFSLVSVPLVSPPGAVDVGRRSYKGCSVRVIPVYDGINDESMWRLDVLYGVKTVDSRLAVRLSGTA